MSDKDLLARLKAKAAQQSTPSPSAETAEGGSGLLERLKAKTEAPQIEPEAPAVETPEEPALGWSPEEQKPSIEVPQPQVVGTAIASKAAAPQPKVVSTQKAVKAPFRDAEIKIKSKTPLELEIDRTTAVESLSKDFDGNVSTLGPQFQQHALSIPYTDPNNPINKITDPHGDPAYTGTYLQSRINTLLSDINKANAEGDLQSRDQYQNTLKDLRKAGATMVDLQLFSKEYSNKQYLPEAAQTAQKAALQQYESQKAELNKKLAAIDKWEHPNSVQAEKERKRIRVVELGEAEKKYQEEVRRIKSQTKYNPVLLGAEREMLLGNKDAKKDYEALMAGKSIDPAKNYAYQDIGRRLIQYGIDNTQNENAKKEAAKHADVEGKALISENLPLLVDRARQVIGNKKYNDENPFSGGVRQFASGLADMAIPSMFRPDISQEDIKRYAEEEGYGEEIVNELLKEPGAVPKSISVPQQVAKGALNFLAPSIYSSGVRALGGLYGVPSEKMDEFFHPGWQEERGLAAKIAGNAPSDQNSFRNVRGALGLMAETVGMMSVFGPAAGEIAGSVSGATGIGEMGAERIANAGIMAFEGYNNAYNESKEIVGDKPEDEGTRQVYSLLSGLANGAIFSIHPPSRLVKAATGEMVKSGEQLVNEIRKSGIKGIMSSEFVPSYAKYIREIGKAQGIIVAQADANLMAQNALKNVFSKDGHKKPITEGLGEETLRTYISFFIPTLAGGVGAARSETPLNRAAAFEVASEPQKYKDFAKSKLDDGTYTESQYREAIKGIDMLDASLKNTPVLNNHDQELTPDQVKEYMFNLTQDAALRERVDKIRKEAELFKREPDKAQTAPLEQKIGDLFKRRMDILGEKRPEPVTKKPEENLEDSDKKDITLQSDIDSEESSQQKPKQDERIESNEGRQGNAEQAESTGQRKDSEVRQAADDQGRQQHQEAGVLVEPEKPEEKTPEQGAPKRPAQRVKGQRRKFVEEEPELPLPEGKAAPSEEIISVEPVSERSGFAHTKGAFKDVSGKIYKSTESKSGPTQEHDILTGLQDIDNVVRVSKSKVQTDKGEAFEIEELTPLGKDDQISMEEAREVMATMKEMDDRGIYTGEFELGRDSKGKLKIFDLSTAEKLKKKDSNYSTYEDNLFRIKEHLSKEGQEVMSRETNRDIEDAEAELLSEIHPELGMAYDRSGSDVDQARRVEAAWAGIEDPKNISNRDLYDAGYRFNNGVFLNPELLDARRKELKDYIVKQSRKQDASTRSKEQQQKGPEQGGEPKYEGPEQAGSETKAAEAEDRDSDIGGEGQEKEVVLQEPETPAREITISREEQNASKKRREEGKYTLDGVEYVRNDVQEGPVGSEGTLQFSDKDDEQFEYMLVEAENLQPSHVDGRRNPNFFIPEAQPKERSDDASIAASDRIGHKPDLNKVGASPNAYSGAPVVNERGEIIQGNNRGEGLKKHYRNGGDSYKKQLAENAEQFGLTADQVNSMKKPILVRRIKGSDEKAIRLGNFQAASIETGGKRRLDPISTSRRMTEQDKVQLVSAILEGNDQETLAKNIRDAFPRIFQILRPYLNSAEIESMLERNGKETKEGVSDVEALISQFIFDGGRADLPERFHALPHNGRRAIIKALPHIFGVSKENSLVQDLQVAIGAARDFIHSGLSWDQWLKTGDLFSAKPKTEDLYTPMELLLAKMLAKPKTQGELADLFQKYAAKVNGIKRDPFDLFRTEDVPGIPKEEAIKEVFNIENYEPEPAKVTEPEPVPAGEGELKEPEAGVGNVEGEADREAPDTEGVEGEPEPDEFAEADKRLAEIADEEKTLQFELKKQLAAQKQYNDALLKAEREKDIEGWNKQNENLKKKEVKIASINERLIALAKEERAIELDKKMATYKSRASAMRKFAEDITKGTSGMLGVFPVINSHLVKPFIDAVANIYQHIGNLDVAISKAIDKFVFDGLQKSLTKRDVREIRQALEWMEKPITSKPKLSKANEEIANEFIDDILDRDVDFSVDDAAQEINEMDISDTLKAKLNDYIRWEVSDRERYNSETLREPARENDFLDKYEMTRSDKITKYLTGETQEDIFGQQVQYDLDSKETFDLEDAVQDSANMIGLAKHHYGTNDVVLFAENLLGKIAGMREGADNRQTVKKILALSGLHNELHGERVRTEEKLMSADKSEAPALRARLRKINQIIARAEVQHRDLVSSASEQMNAARVMRLVRNTFFKELFAERILNDAQRREKQAVSDALEKTEVRESVAEKGSFRTKNEAKQEIAAAEEAIKQGQNDLFEQTVQQKKSKGLVDRIKDKVSGKKPRKDGRKEVVEKSEAEKKAAKYLRGGTIEELLEKAKEQTKKPC